MHFVCECFILTNVHVPHACLLRGGERMLFGHQGQEVTDGCEPSVDAGN